MYNAVKRHEVYLGRTKCLGGGGSTSTTPQKSTTPQASNNAFKPWFKKTTAFVAAPVEESDSTPVNSGFDTSEESTSNADPTSEDLSGLYIPVFSWWGEWLRMGTHDKDGQGYPGWWATIEALLYLPESRPLCQKLPPSKKCMKAPAAEGASQNNSGSKSQSTGTNLSTHSTGFSSKGGSSVKAPKVPCLNPDPFTCLIALKIGVKLL